MPAPLALFDDLLASLPEGEILSVHIGLFWTAVVARRHGQTSCGLAATERTLGPATHQHPPIPAAGHLLDSSPSQLAALVHSNSPPEVSLGMAAINALLPHPPGLLEDLHAEEVIVRLAADKKVALVGHFPFVTRLRPRLATLWVLEQTPLPGDLPASCAAEIIPQADLLAITASTLLNGTFTHLLSLRRPSAILLLIGPSAPLSPLLFKHGIGIISGSIVADLPATLLALTQGANFRQLRQTGVRLVTLASPALHPTLSALQG